MCCNVSRQYSCVDRSAGPYCSVLRSRIPNSSASHIWFESLDTGICDCLVAHNHGRSCSDCRRNKAKNIHPSDAYYILAGGFIILLILLVFCSAYYPYAYKRELEEEEYE
uniref:MIP06148p n=1 Tax=Drosophila melanogaster TaxID=7227 RepID=C0P8N4_DROME|nr:MIP06148p [Drosophila melanogaster]